MDTGKKNTSVTEEDIAFLEQELRNSPHPFLLDEMTKKLAYKKIAHQLSQEVKKYDPYCIYEIGDSICKEYDESLTVSSKGNEHFKGAVVLKIVNKVAYKDFNCEMLEVDYSGGGVFRKYINYMKKTKTQVLLPSNLEGKAQVPEKMKREKDPRLSELPMDDKDLRSLEKNLRTILSKSSKFFNWNDYWQLNENQVEIEDKKIKEIENYLLETKESAETTSLVNKFFGLAPSDKLFEIYLLSLNHILEKKHKKNFVYVSPAGWGKWQLKKILDSLLKNLPLSAPSAKLPHFEEQEEPEKTQVETSSLKVYLTWREILSGGIKIPVALNKELSSSREYIFTDEEEGKNYTMYYYPSHSFFLGLKDFYEQHNVPQGASLTLERKSINQFNFWLKKSKKKLSVYKIAYDPHEDKFRDTGEELFTFSLPNKIIHLEKETFARLCSLYSQRDDLDLKELLIFIFKNFGIETNNFSLHYQRAYHLVDVLKQTYMEDVELTLLNSPEFSKSDKKKGTFFFHEILKIEEEEKLEVPPEIPEEAPPMEAQAEAIPVEQAPKEVPVGETRVEERPPSPEERMREEVIPGAREEVLEEKVTIERPPRKERVKVPKKRKLKLEGEKVQRLRKGEKRFIEEKIEIEELEQEALTAIKEKKEEEEREKIPAKKKKEKIKKSLVSEEPVFGLFAEKLKTALDKKGKQKKKK